MHQPRVPKFHQLNSYTQHPITHLHINICVFSGGDLYLSIRFSAFSSACNPNTTRKVIYARYVYCCAHPISTSDPELTTIWIASGVALKDISLVSRIHHPHVQQYKDIKRQRSLNHSTYHSPLAYHSPLIIIYHGLI